MRSFQEFKRAKIDPAKAQVEAVNVCSMIMNIRKQPFILVMNQEGERSIMRIIKTRLRSLKQYRLDALNNKIESKLKDLEDFKTKNNLTDVSPEIVKRKANIENEKIRSLKIIDNILKERKSLADNKIKTLRDNWDKKEARKLLTLEKVLTNIGEITQQPAEPSIAEVNRLGNPALDSKIYSSDSLVFDALKEGTSVVGHQLSLKPMNMSLTFP